MPATKKFVRVQSDDEARKKRLAQDYEAYLAMLLKQKKISEEDKLKFEAKAQDTPSVFTFLSKEDSTQFFTKCAAERQRFICFTQDSQGKLTGEVCFSDGNDGKFYESTLRPETADLLENCWKKLKGNPETKAQLMTILKSNDELKLLVALRELKFPTEEKSAVLGPITEEESIDAARPK